MNCIYCGKIVEKPRGKYCSRQCYQKQYYRDHMKEKSEYSKAKYIPHPRPKLKTEEDFKKYRKEYYEKHKEYYKQRNHDYYEAHKNDFDYRHRHNEATKRYLERRILNGNKS